MSCQASTDHAAAAPHRFGPLESTGGAIRLDLPAAVH